MKTYVVTGAASGMGKAITEKLVGQGARVIGVDIQQLPSQDAVIADLSTQDGRTSAAQAVLQICGGVLDGAVMAAGLGPERKKGMLPVIAGVNYFGVVDLLSSWRDALAKSGNAKVVVLGSNSSTVLPMIPNGLIRALLRGNVNKAVAAVRLYGKAAPPFMYGGSKIAVTRWARRTAVMKEWAGANIRMNVVAPGTILTPLIERQLAEPESAKQVKSLPMPVGRFGKPEDVVPWIEMLLSSAADFMCGSVVFVDGGTDAHFRGDDWPKTIPLHKMLSYIQHYPGFFKNAL
jgi:NAD(P)-dependent dehydrogenase (short-subunit alcohol dehydrogenase family)